MGCVMSKKTKNFAAKQDFTEDMLPNNRKTQFFMILRNRSSLLLKAALFTFLFCIPILLAASSKTVFASNFYQQYTSEKIDYATLQNYLSYTNFWMSLIYVPCLMIALIGVAGVNRLTHQLIFGEGILFKEDYLLGIKNNGKQYLLYSFLFSMLYVLCRWLLFYCQEDVFSVVIVFALLIICVPYFFALLLYSNIYTSKGSELIRNVCYMILKSKWKMFVYVIVVAAPIILMSLLLTGYLFMAVAVVYILLLPIISLFGNAIFAGVFDELFNYANNVEIVKKGLFVDEKEKELILKTHQRLVKELKERSNKI